MKIFISAAEASSDTHAGALIQALRNRWSVQAPGEALEIFGIGGPRSQSAGLEVIIPASEFLAMGFVEVLRKIPSISRALSQIEQVARMRQPNLAILLDYPDFHFKLAEKLKKQGVPVICMIPPKIWAWRSGRIHRMRELYAHVLSILPFEKGIYEHASLPATYIGNPLLDELPLDASREALRERHGVEAGRKMILLMPGSRPAELKYHLEPLLRAAALIQKRQTSATCPLFWMPLAPTEDRDAIRERVQALAWTAELDLRITRGDAWDAMVMADAAIIKSGTSSLEAALLGLPHVVVYRASPISEWIFRTFVRYEKPISLVNLIHDFSSRVPTVVSELILKDFSPERMCEELVPLLDQDSPHRKEMVVKFGKIRDLLESAGSSPSVRAADAVFDVLRASQTGRAAGRST